MPSEPGRTLAPYDHLLVYDLLDHFKGRLDARTLRLFLANYLAFGPAGWISIAETHLDAVGPFYNR